MNRQQRRRSAHVSKRSKAPAAKQLSQRARFEQDLRTALVCEDIKLVNVVPGQEQSASDSSGAGKPTGETYWVFTVHAEGRFLHIRSGRGTLADVASGVTRAVRDAIKKQDEPTGAVAISAPSPGAPSIVEEASKPALPVQFAPQAPTPAPVVFNESELSLAERIKRAQAGGA